MKPLFREPDFTQDNSYCWHFNGGDHKLWWARGRWSLVSWVFGDSGASVKVEIALGHFAPGLLFCALECSNG
jgi:hypothetical protein